MVVVEMLATSASAGFAEPLVTVTSSSATTAIAANDTPARSFRIKVFSYIEQDGLWNRYAYLRGASFTLTLVESFPRRVRLLLGSRQVASLERDVT
jgi:hypothetical protein